VGGRRVVSSAKVTTDGKFFRLGEDRFPFRGVTYGTFQPRPTDAARFPDRERVKHDFAAMNAAGFTVVRTYTVPPDDVLEAAADWNLRVLAGVFYPDWRYLVGLSARQRRRVAADARIEVRAVARRLAGNNQVLGLCLGNEVPADVIRWFGTSVVAGAIAEFADAARDEDADQLLTYANYPTAEYLPLDELDFLTFNVFLERRHDFRRYLTRLHHLAGDRPLVLGEMGLHAGSGLPGGEGEQHQAQVLDWQLETALERGLAGTCVFSWTDEWWVGDAAVEGWHFGLTRTDRSPRPSLEVVCRWNRRQVADLPHEWPSISVVICAYNAADTLGECLGHTCALDYPRLEILVVDDGSTDATPEIARRYPRARLVSIPHAGLSVARNAGFEAARGELIAYLDSDAYPSPEWLYYLALGMDHEVLGGVGGPNVPPRDDPIGAQQVAKAPGGPVHVLLGDDRAEHIPGCNMAFRKEVLAEVGGFNPIYTSAGDDVDLCWRVLDRGWEIGFHPAALVWHHRRAGLRKYLRQQLGYGRSEALVEARHPDRFSPTGSARWKGRIYDSLPVPFRQQRVYRGLYGAAAYQSVYRSGGHALDLAHQVGVPLAFAVLLSAPAGLISGWLAAPAVAALMMLTILGAMDVARAAPTRVASGRGPGFRLGFRLGVTAMHLLQPLVRSWGRSRHRELARKDLPGAAMIAGPVTHIGRGALLLPAAAPRTDVAAAIIAHLRQAGVRLVTPSGWEDCDARIVGSFLLAGDVVTSGHPVHCIQIRVRRRPRWSRVGMVAVICALLTTVNVWVAGVALAAVVLDAAIGVRRTGALFRRVVRAAVIPPPG
jgi:glycosyltransferase involved in cell wall biosynthesis